MREVVDRLLTVDAVNKNLGVAGFMSADQKKRLLWGSKKLAAEQVWHWTHFMKRILPTSIVGPGIYLHGWSRVSLRGRLKLSLMFTKKMCYVRSWRFFGG